MFDPTVFDNLKVVLEGAVYDLDLEGLIEVKSRNDLVNLADMSRTWSISFQEDPAGTEAEIQLSIIADQLQTEWKKTADYAGCSLQISFYQWADSESGYVKPLTSIREIWGEDVSVDIEISYNPLAEKKQFKHTWTIYFDRLITEEHAGDLESVVESVCTTLKKIDYKKGAGL